MASADTSSQRLRLAKLVRELEGQLERNRGEISRPWIAHPDHVKAYFTAYQDYLAEALTYPELPNRNLLEQRRDSPIFVHRDNIPSLAGRIGELAAALEASTLDIRKELETARHEIDQLREEVQRLTAETERLRKAIPKPQYIGGKTESDRSR